MAKYYGIIGYAETVESERGLHKEVIIPRPYYGDVRKASRRLVSSEHLNTDVAVTNTISIVADAYAYEHFFAIRYAEWAGAKWKVETVEVARPRLILTLGGVWNGETD